MWAEKGVLAYLSGRGSGRQAAEDCRAVAHLVCTAALVSRIDGRGGLHSPSSHCIYALASSHLYQRGKSVGFRESFARTSLEP